MKKIGIISELRSNSFNYGSRLQSYALNYYLNKNYKNYETESLIFSNNSKRKRTQITYLSLFSLLKKFNKPKKEKQLYDFSKRLEKANEFTKKYTKLCPKPLNYNLLKNTNYDVFIVGSDVVWIQSNRAVNRIKFLDFKNQKRFRKISYAASFGIDYIPKENRKYLSKVLKKFDYISLREKSSIKMLNNLKIENVNHVCDPTLLLTKNEWVSVSEKVDVKDKFIFAYMLGKDKKQRDEIKKIAKKLNLKIVTISHADGFYNEVDNDFGNYKINNCSPAQWIYLIKNAEYIFTDSFHGTVFSTIFEKKFIVLKRDYTQNINNRLIDYLDTIDESDKSMLIPNYEKIKEMNWDYKKINKKLKVFIDKSKEYLDKALEQKGL